MRLTSRPRPTHAKAATTRYRGSLEQGSGVKSGLWTWESGDGFPPQHAADRLWPLNQDFRQEETLVVSMARLLRVQFSGALYRVTVRGKERKPIFRDERDRPAQVRKGLSQWLSAGAQARSAWPSVTAACALSATAVHFTCRDSTAQAQHKGARRAAAGLRRPPPPLHTHPSPRFPPSRDILHPTSRPRPP
jgi:hypothetical protein